jgi:hypothetical protein
MVISLPLRTHEQTTELCRIAAKNDTDKGTSYTRVYHALLAAVREEPLRLLEIGVYNGGSLRMWREFLPNATLFAIDVDPRCLAFEQEIPGATIRLVDQADPAQLRRFVAETGGGYDVIIDDGGHTMDQQITSFEVLFPHVVSGGTYVIEDLGTSYWAEYGGRDLGEEGTGVALVKRLVDSANGAFLPPVAGFQSTVSPESRVRLRTDIASVSVHLGQAVITKT